MTKDKERRKGHKKGKKQFFQKKSKKMKKGVDKRKLAWYYN
jgi:hypothetical protein